MGVVTYEGVVRNGKVTLTGGIRLPEGGTVYVVVPEPAAATRSTFRGPTSRLVPAADADDFTMEVEKEPGAFLR